VQYVKLPKNEHIRVIPGITEKEGDRKISGGTVMPYFDHWLVGSETAVSTQIGCVQCVVPG